MTHTSPLPASAAARHTDITVGAPAGYAHSLADLQDEANAQYGMTPAQTLAAADSLYHRGLITYPRTEARVLPMNRFDEAARIVRGYGIAADTQRYDSRLQAPGWVDDVPGDHHGITLNPIAAASLFGVPLSEPETRIYRLVHARFLSLFQRPAAR